MKLREIKREALMLNETERVELVLSLLSSMAPPGLDITDQEVLRRDFELESGAVEPISHREFVQLVQRNRGR